MSSSATTSVTISENCLVVKGALQFSDVSILSVKSVKLLEGCSAKEVVIDLEKVDRIDSAGIALLLEWKRTCHYLKKTIKLVNVQKQTQSLIKTYRLDPFFL